MNYSLIENTFEPVAIIGRELNITHFNASFATFVKLSPRVLKKGPSLTEIFTLDKEIYTNLLNDLAQNKSIALSPEIPSSLKHSEEINYTFVLKLTPLENDLFQLYILDMSVENSLYKKYRQQMDELKKNHQTILQADKLRTLGELTASISHEINNPLAIAFGNIEIIQSLLEVETTSHKELENYVKKVEISIGRIKDIITNMKTYIHKDKEAAKEYCDVHNIINNALEFIKPAVKGTKVDIKFNTEQEKIITLINKVELGQVIVNLCKNAIDAILMSKSKNIGSIKINLKKEKPHNDILISISDNGPGISDEHLGQIFDPFFTTKDADKGTGLGLAISKQIIERNNGELTVESSSSGTTFNIKLPAIEISSLAFDDNFIQNISDDTKKKILVVDDEVEVLNVISRYIMDLGHIIIGSTSPNDALDILSKVRVDMVITDYNMPEMTGADFSKTIRDINKIVPIYYLTSKQFIDNFQDDKQKFDISGLILKPFSRDEIIKVLETTLGKEDGQH